MIEHGRQANTHWVFIVSGANSENRRKNVVPKPFCYVGTIAHASVAEASQSLCTYHISKLEFEIRDYASYVS